MRPRTYLLDMNAAHLALTIALRNLARARELGDAVSIAQATRRAAQARAVAGAK